MTGAAGNEPCWKRVKYWLSHWIPNEVCVSVPWELRSLILTSNNMLSHFFYLLSLFIYIFTYIFFSVQNYLFINIICFQKQWKERKGKWPENCRGGEGGDPEFWSGKVSFWGWVPLKRRTAHPGLQTSTLFLFLGGAVPLRVQTSPFWGRKVWFWYPSMWGDEGVPHVF